MSKQDMEEDITNMLVPVICEHVSKFFDHDEHEIKDWGIIIKTGRNRAPGHDRIYPCPTSVSLSINFMMTDCKRTTKTEMDYDACMKWKCARESDVVFTSHD